MGLKNGILSSLLICLAAVAAHAQLGTGKRPPAFTNDDSLRGSLNPYRSWWDAKHYDVWVEPDYDTKTIKGKVILGFEGTAGGRMQLDLQQPMQLDSVFWQNNSLHFSRKNNVVWIDFPEKISPGLQQLHLFFSGKPAEARRPPWDGGWIWAKDEKGRPWMSVACQGLGASVWFPCKDHQSDEPDLGASLTIVVPAELKGIGNGKLISTMPQENKLAYKWEVKNPINLYNIIPYIGAYNSFEEVFAGEKGNLQCQYWVLDYNVDKARSHFKQVPEMLKCFEHWMGPFPFYEDGYKLVEAPHLGMEHQSGIAYGNRYFNGYRGSDLSGSGFGLKWDFIIIHESGHEWFGNNITTKDIADMWVHEGFTNYTETLFTECKSGLQGAEAYVQGIRRNIRNDIPIIGPYGVNKEGSGDMYYKGSNMIHTLRTMMQNDEQFRQLLRNLSHTFYHQTVTTQQVEAFLEKESGLGPWLPAFFNQYLRTTQIPVLQWQLGNNGITLNWANTVPGFAMKVYVPATATSGKWVVVADMPVTLPNKLSAAEITALWNRNLYIEYSQQLIE